MGNGISCDKMKASIDSFAIACSQTVESYTGDNKPWIAKAKAVSSYDWRDKAVKLAITLNSLALWIGEHTAMSQADRDGLNSANKSLDMARAVFGLLNVFGAALWDLADAVRKAALFALNKVQGANNRNLLNNADEAKRRNFQINEDKYPGNWGRALGFGAEVSRISERSCFIFCFGVANPIRYVNGHFPGRMNPETVAVGNKFGSVWMAYHVSGLAGNTCDFAREGLILSREKSINKAHLVNYWDRIGSLSF